MAKQQVEIDTKGLDILVVGLKGFEKEMPKAAFSAVKRTLSSVRTAIGKIVPTEYQIKSTDVKKAISKPKVKMGNMTSAHLVVKGSTLSFSHFRFTPKTPGTKRRVKVKIMKKGTYKRIDTEPKPFVMHTGAMSVDKVQHNVFKRVGMQRFPITVLRSLSVPQMVGNEDVAEKIQKTALQKLDERLQHEIEYRLEKFRRKQESK